mmetsp:Transcript_134144/g.304190  ORF Transcript_134144/g.304190 Transcript_134144/m.304190 type:complete len:263 (-) Transcript_134144:1842-2630(-)
MLEGLHHGNAYRSHFVVHGADRFAVILNNVLLAFHVLRAGQNGSGHVEEQHGFGQLSHRRTARIHQIHCTLAMPPTLLKIVVARLHVLVDRHCTEHLFTHGVSQWRYRVELSEQARRHNRQQQRRQQQEDPRNGRISLRCCEPHPGCLCKNDSRHRRPLSEANHHTVPNLRCATLCLQHVPRLEHHLMNVLRHVDLVPCLPNNISVRDPKIVVAVGKTGCHTLSLGVVDQLVHISHVHSTIDEPNTDSNNTDGPTPSQQILC